MNKIFYECKDFILYLSFVDFEFRKQRTITDLEIISYEEFIREIDTLPDKSQVWKRLTIIEAGKLAGILSEVA